MSLDLSSPNHLQSGGRCRQWWGWASAPGIWTVFRGKEKEVEEAPSPPSWPTFLDLGPDEFVPLPPLDLIPSKAPCICRCTSTHTHTHGATEPWLAKLHLTITLDWLLISFCFSSFLFLEGGDPSFTVILGKAHIDLACFVVFLLFSLLSCAPPIPPFVSHRHDPIYVMYHLEYA